MPAGTDLESEIAQAMAADRYRLRRELRGIQAAQQAGKPFDRRQARLVEAVAHSVAQLATRRRGLPEIRYPDELPISARRAEIAQAIGQHQVVIVCGETGSGKSTQLPKICLELGLGVGAMIGHTQPRRIAARSIAARIAEELGSPLGQAVGYKHRFTDVTGPGTYIKLMTDGILLAETQQDRYLNQYDVIILDEAHERSLNIDFLLGYLKQLLPKRPDLKLIITSATIDAQRFARHFPEQQEPAPVIEVSGRTFPVEIRHRPIEPEEETSEPDVQRAVLGAIDELARLDRGDMLVFMPTERDIHELAKHLRSRALPGDAAGATEILPLYARLPAAQQQRVFHSGPGRRIVIATNVAESSLTVPGIRYVIDPGTARISRYSPRAKTQRLPIEPISQASADQRAGRCGRVAAGVCVRLYSQEDYDARDRYTPPEIQRTNLASVVLQIKALRLGDIERFPFLDPPRPETVRAGFQTLHEIGALDDRDELTEIGWQLSRLPVDPRIGRMILAGAAEGCQHEILVIAAALSVQDPRERPLERREEADRCHLKFVHGESDFLGFLKLWDFYHELKATVSRGQLRKACKQNYLSYNRMREWADVHLQLLELVRRAGFGVRGSGLGVRGSGEPSDRPDPQVPLSLRERAGVRGSAADSGAGRPAVGRVARSGDRPQQPSGGPPQPAAHNRRRDDYGRIHRALLTGLLSNVAFRAETYEYTAAGGGKFHLWPGSGVFAKKPKWIMAAELLETTKRYLRTCARIDRSWIEPAAAHLVRRTYTDLRWDRDAAAAVANECVTLLGLTVEPRRRVEYGRLDHATGRDYLIHHGLVQGDFDLRADFIQHNAELLEELQQLQVKLRRNDLLVGPLARFGFYDKLLPPDVYDGRQLRNWLRVVPRVERRKLFMSKADLLLQPDAAPPEYAFPDSIAMEHAELPLAYRFEPGAADDGLSVSVPLEALGQVDRDRLGWLVPGLLETKVVALIKSLPKTLRVLLVPAPDTARTVLASLRFGQGSLLAAVASQLGRIAGQPIPLEAFQADKLPPDLQINVRVLGGQGELLAQGRDLDEHRRQLAPIYGEIFGGAPHPGPLPGGEGDPWIRDGLTHWDLDELPAEIALARSPLGVKAFPMLIDRGGSVSLRLANSVEKARHNTRFGLRRFVLLACRRAIRTQVDWLPGLEKMAVHAATLGGLDVREELITLLADRAAQLDEAAWPRTQAAYDAWLQATEARIPVAAQDLAELAPALFAAYHRAQLAVEQALAPNWRYAAADIRQQMQALLPPNFLSTTPWSWLVHYPRYLKAIPLRLEKLRGGSLDRDRSSLDDEIRPRWTAYLERVQLHRQLDLFDPALVQFRWMLEEYRVSLFAQELGTAIPVSGKRLDAQWELVQT